jgi:predicted MFS family arabinose efflux permease
MATVYLAKALILGTWPFILDRYGTKIIFTTTLVMISPIPILFMVARSLASQILLEIYSSVWWSSWDLLTGLYNLYLFARDVRPIALSIIVFSTNMGASSASIIGSIISSSIPYGSEITFTLSALSRVLVSLLAFKKLPLLDLKIKQ